MLAPRLGPGKTRVMPWDRRGDKGGVLACAPPLSPATVLPSSRLTRLFSSHTPPVMRFGRSIKAQGEGDTITNVQGHGRPSADFTPGGKSSRPSFLPRPGRAPLHPGARDRRPGRGGHRPGSFFPGGGGGSQGPRRPQTRETLASGVARRGLPGVSPAGLNGQPAPDPGPQRLGRDAAEAAQSPERRHLAPPRTAGRRTGGSASCAPPRGLPAHWRHGAALLEAGRVAGARRLHPGSAPGLHFRSQSGGGARFTWTLVADSPRREPEQLAAPAGPSVCALPPARLSLALPPARVLPCAPPGPPPARAPLPMAASEPGPPGAAPGFAKRLGAGKASSFPDGLSGLGKRGPKRGWAGPRAPAKPK